MERHVRIHTNDRPFICVVCSKRFTRKEHVLSHMKSHIDTLPFECLVCSNRFYTRENCGKFQETFEPNAQFEEASYHCSMCPFTSLMKHILDKHIQTHSKKYTFVCEVCYKRYQSNRDLEVHHRSHSGERPFVCTVCYKGFSHKGHQKVLHSTSKSLPWKNVSFSSILTTSIRNHELNPNLTIPFPSSGGQSCTDQMKQDLHLWTHTKPVTYNCSICQKTFNRKDNLKVHYRIHSGERPFRCTVCNKGFNTKQNMQSHFFSYHKMPSF
ncbi:hypothetical protein NPIL_178271 [Nephila pilipes]|uniref:C2H2-type domain-containing protein n=1 Tax=Nephila pilipes TaxID=299642 RepID=A0A8X6N170_NEPPI|nr:hypothetical protein NPIL_178271 [Nephila pilipes]